MPWEGSTISTATAKVLMSVERDNEAEAIACGKYDVIPYDDEESAYIAAMNTPEEIAGRAFDVEYNRLPNNGFCEVPF